MCAQLGARVGAGGFVKRSRVLGIVPRQPSRRGGVGYDAGVGRSAGTWLRCGERKHCLFGKTEPTLQGALVLHASSGAMWGRQALG